MKAKEYDVIVTLEAVRNDAGTRIIPIGTKGTIVDCYSTPVEGYAVDLSLPDEECLGGYDYENVILYPHQFDIVPDAPKV